MPKSTFLVFIFALALAAKGQAAFKLSCFYYDRNSKDNFSAWIFSPSLPHINAKDAQGNEFFIEGRVVNGFFEVTNISLEEARSLCLQSLKQTSTTTELMHMTVKVSTWSRHAPASFTKNNSSLVQKMVSFGDSLSDQGNLRDLLKITPGKLYFFGRFTNGRNWVDYLQNVLGLAVLNFASAGSVSGYAPITSRKKDWNQKMADITLFFSGTLQNQLEDYKKRLNGPIDSRTMFSIWVGSNDYLSLIENDDTAPVFLDHPDHQWGYNNIILNVTNNINKQIENLYALGARNFLIPNLPDLGKLPRIFENLSYLKGQPNERRFIALSNKMTHISTNHNVVLAAKIAELRSRHPDINITFVDIAGELARVKVPLSFLEKQVSFDGEEASIGQACFPNYSYFAFRSPEVTLCSRPHEVFFLDGVHPTTFGHCLLAFFMQEAAAKSGILRAASIKTYLKLCRPESTEEQKAEL